MLVSYADEPARSGNLTALHDLVVGFEFEASSKIRRYSQKSAIFGRQLFLFAGNLRDVQEFLNRITSDPEFNDNELCEAPFKKAVKGLSFSALYVHRGKKLISRIEYDCDIKIRDGITVIGEGSGFDDLQEFPDSPDGAVAGSVFSLCRDFLAYFIDQETRNAKQADKAYGGAYEIIALTPIGFRKLEYRLDFFDKRDEDAVLAHTKALRLIYRQGQALISAMDASDSNETNPAFILRIVAAKSLTEKHDRLSVGLDEFWKNSPHINIQIVRTNAGYYVSATPWEPLPFKRSQKGEVQISATEQYMEWQRKMSGFIQG